MRRGATAILGLLLSSGVAAAQQPSPAAQLAAGDEAWGREDHAAAFRAYQSVVRADSAFSTRALFRLGTLHAWANRMPQAIACHSLYVRLEPADLEGRVALARTYAWASRFPLSLAHYDTVLAREAGYRDAVLGRATTLAWWGRLPPAIDALEQWQRAHAADTEAALLRARFLGWAGRLDEALVLYESLSAGGASAEAEQGRAQVLAWRGDLVGAEERWREILARRPDDAASWVGLGQVLRWQGRTFAARDALARARALDPASNDAREQLRWVEAEISPAATLTLVHAEDSEANVSTTLEVGGSVVRPGNLRLIGSARSRRVAQGSGDGLSIPAAYGAAQWQPGGGAWTFRVDAGVVRYPERLAAATTVWQGGARVSGRPSPRLTLGAGISRSPFDDIVAAAARRLTMTTMDADVGVTLHPRVSLGVAASSGRAAGDLASNDRGTALAALRWTPTRGVGAALTHREVAWDRAAPGIYFAPKRFAITEASLRWEWPRDLGLVASGELGLGSQSVRFEGASATSRLASRGTMRLGWRPLPGRELIAALQIANVAAAGTVTASEYRYGAATLTARWTF